MLYVAIHVISLGQLAGLSRCMLWLPSGTDGFDVCGSLFRWLVRRYAGHQCGGLAPCLEVEERVDGTTS